MEAIPDAHKTTAAAHQLTEQIRHCLRTPPTSTDAVAVLELVVELMGITDRILWCRDAALALARRPECPVSWIQLEQATGIADATLNGRLQRWREREQVPS